MWKKAESTQRALNHGLASGSPFTSFGQEFGYELSRFEALDQAGSIAKDRQEIYDRLIEQLEQSTGRRLESPFARMSPGSPAHGVPPTSLREAEEQFFNELNQLGQEHNLEGIGPLSATEVDSIVQQHREALMLDRAERASRRVGFGAHTGAMLGTLAGAATDPPVLMSMVFGAPWSAGVLRFALTEAGIAGTTEGLIQTQIHRQRQAIGEDPTISEALQTIALTGGAGFLFGGLLRGIPAMVRGNRSLLNRAEELPSPSGETRTAQAHLERLTSAQEASPYAPTPRAAQEHLVRLDAAIAALRNRQTVELGSPVEPLSRAGIRLAGQAPSQVVQDAVGPAVSQAATAVRQTGARIASQEQARIAAATALRPIADDAATVAALFRTLREEAPGLQGIRMFLERSGGIRSGDERLARAGISTRTFPGMLRREGHSLDDAARAAQEEGFFPELGRPATADDLLDAVSREARGERIARGVDQGRTLDLETRDVLREGLDALGISPRAFSTPEDFQRALVSRLDEQAVSARTSPRPVNQLPEAEARLSPEELAELDQIADQQFLNTFANRMDETIMVEDGSGAIIPTTPRQLLREMEREAADLEALRVCAIGRRAA